MKRSELRLTRGSRRHVLDLLEQPDFASILNALLAPAGAVAYSGGHRRPRGRNEPAESDVRAFVREVSLQDADLAPLADWWVPEAFTALTWDLLSECWVMERKGVLLVEAKAQVSELDDGCKPLSATASERALQNH